MIKVVPEMSPLKIKIINKNSSNAVVCLHPSKNRKVNFFLLFWKKSCGTRCQKVYQPTFKLTWRKKTKIFKNNERVGGYIFVAPNTAILWIIIFWHIFLLLSRCNNFWVSSGLTVIGFLNCYKINLWIRKKGKLKGIIIKWDLIYTHFFKKHLKPRPKVA